MSYACGKRVTACRGNSPSHWLPSSRARPFASVIDHYVCSTWQAKASSGNFRLFHDNQSLRYYRDRFSIRRVRMDFVSYCLLVDLSLERSDPVAKDRTEPLSKTEDLASEHLQMWATLQPGQGVLLECPSRWYLGVVYRRTPMTVVLASQYCICGHDLGDLGLFLDGKVSTSTELTPLPRGIELSMSSIDTVQPFPVAFLKEMCKRTHNPEGERGS